MNMNAGALDRALSECLMRGAGAGQSAVLFTGGLDSTVLSVLARTLSPRLVFGAVLDPVCREYNARSLMRCQAIAGHLGLVFESIGISREDYVTNKREVSAYCGDSRDRDLPAVMHLMKQLKQGAVGVVFSGMGANELFSALGYERFPQETLRAAYEDHRKIARRQGIVFECPFLDQPVIDVVLNLPMRQRVQRDLLKNILKQQPKIFSCFQGQKAQHSMIPDSFLLNG